MIFRRLLLFIASMALGAAVAVPSVVSANDEVMALSQDANNWVMWGRTYDGTRYSPLDQINKENVGNLQVAWTFSTGVLRGHEGGPLVIGDTMWIHTPFPNKVFSINLSDQTINWVYSPKQDAAATVPVMCCDTVYRGLAYADGKIFLQQADTTLVGLDANTGERLWSTVNGDPKAGSTNTNAPSWSATRCTPGSAVASSAFEGSWPPTTSTTEAWSGRDTAPAPTRRC